MLITMINTCPIVSGILISTSSWPQKSRMLKALKRYARELLSYSDKLLTEAIKYGELIEVKNDG